eukprot:tig00001629_g9518.t2
MSEELADGSFRPPFSPGTMQDDVVLHSAPGFGGAVAAFGGEGPEYELPSWIDERAGSAVVGNGKVAVLRGDGEAARLLPGYHPSLPIHRPDELTVHDLPEDPREWGAPVLFSREGFRGDAHALQGLKGAGVTDLPSAFDDTAASIVIPTGTKVTVFEGKGGSMRARTLFPGRYELGEDLGEGALDGAVSSVLVEGDAPCGPESLEEAFALYAGTDFFGTEFRGAASGDLPPWIASDASSIIVANNKRVILHAAPGAPEGTESQEAKTLTLLPGFHRALPPEFQDAAARVVVEELPPDVTSWGVPVLCEGEGLRGAQTALPRSVAPLGEVFNLPPHAAHSISSLAVPAGFQVTLFSERRGGGEARTFGPGSHELRDLSDVAQSFLVEALRPEPEPRDEEREPAAEAPRGTGPTSRLFAAFRALDGAGAGEAEMRAAVRDYLDDATEELRAAARSLPPPPEPAPEAPPADEPATEAAGGEAGWTSDAVEALVEAYRAGAAKEELISAASRAIVDYLTAAGVADPDPGWHDAEAGQLVRFVRAVAGSLDDKGLATVARLFIAETVHVDAAGDAAPADPPPPVDPAPASDDTEAEQDDADHGFSDAAASTGEAGPAADLLATFRAVAEGRASEDDFRATAKAFLDKTVGPLQSGSRESPSTELTAESDSGAPSESSAVSESALDDLLAKFRALDADGASAEAFHAAAESFIQSVTSRLQRAAAHNDDSSKDTAVEGDQEATIQDSSSSSADEAGPAADLLATFRAVAEGRASEDDFRATAKAFLDKTVGPLQSGSRESPSTELTAESDSGSPSESSAVSESALDDLLAKFRALDADGASAEAFHAAAESFIQSVTSRLQRAAAHNDDSSKDTDVEGDQEATIQDSSSSSADEAGPAADLLATFRAVAEGRASEDDFRATAKAFLDKTVGPLQSGSRESPSTELTAESDSGSPSESSAVSESALDDLLAKFRALDADGASAEAFHAAAESFIQSVTSRLQRAAAHNDDSSKDTAVEGDQEATIQDSSSSSADEAGPAADLLATFRAVAEGRASEDDFRATAKAFLDKTVGPLQSGSRESPSTELTAESDSGAPSESSAVSESALDDLLAKFRALDADGASAEAFHAAAESFIQSVTSRLQRAAAHNDDSSKDTDVEGDQEATIQDSSSSSADEAGPAADLLATFRAVAEGRASEDDFRATAKAFLDKTVGPLQSGSRESPSTELTAESDSGAPSESSAVSESALDDLLAKFRALDADGASAEAFHAAAESFVALIAWRLMHASAAAANLADKTETKHTVSQSAEDEISEASALVEEAEKKAEALNEAANEAALLEREADELAERAAEAETAEEQQELAAAAERAAEAAEEKADEARDLAEVVESLSEKVESLAEAIGEMEQAAGSSELAELAETASTLQEEAAEEQRRAEESARDAADASEQSEQPQEGTDSSSEEPYDGEDVETSGENVETSGADEATGDAEEAIAKGDVSSTSDATGDASSTGEDTEATGDAENDSADHHPPSEENTTASDLLATFRAVAEGRASEDDFRATAKAFLDKTVGPLQSGSRESPSTELTAESDSGAPSESSAVSESALDDLLAKFRALDADGASAEAFHAAAESFIQSVTSRLQRAAAHNDDSSKDTDVEGDQEATIQDSSSSSAGDSPSDASGDAESSGEAPGEAESSGDASGDAENSGEAPGEAESSGDASGDAESSGEAPGEAESSGDASGDAESSGEAPGEAESSGDASGDAESSGEAPGEAESSGDASGDAESSGETPGEAESSGDASGDAESSGEAPGEAESSGDASGDAESSGEASGEAESSGDASGDAESSGEASGEAESSGDASGDAESSGETPGEAESSGDASGDAESSGEAPGEAESSGDASGDAESSGEAPGEAESSGDASGDAESSGDAAGDASSTSASRGLDPAVAEAKAAADLEALAAICALRGKAAGEGDESFVGSLTKVLVSDKLVAAGFSVPEALPVLEGSAGALRERILGSMCEMEAARLEENGPVLDEFEGALAGLYALALRAGTEPDAEPEAASETASELDGGEAAAFVEEPDASGLEAEAAEAPDGPDPFDMPLC